MMLKKSLSLLLALMLIVASVPLTAVGVSAADGDTLTVTAKSNIAPSYTQSFDPDTEQITVTWWIQSEETMINAQWIMKYDNTVLKVDETPGVNMTFDEDESVEENMIFRAANGVNSFITMSPKNISGSGIGGSASNWPTGYPLVAEDGVSKIPFISVTFNPVEGATGETVVELEMQIMQIKGSNDYLDYDFIRNSVIVDETIQYLPEIPVAVYAGPIDPDYLPGQPSTVVPTEEPTTVPATEPPTEPPTEEPTTAEPYTEPYTEPPTEPYTEPYTEPPTEESTTVPDVTAGGTSGYCTWRLEGGTLTISGDRRMENYDNAPWYKYRDNIYHIVIDYGVTDIGERAFADCCNAVSVTIPRSVTTIRAESFYNCTGLQDVTIPDTVTYIGNHAFNKCTGLQSVTIPDSVLTIGNSAFYRCAGLQSVTLPDRLTHIDDYTFFSAPVCKA